MRKLRKNKNVGFLKTIGVVVNRHAWIRQKKYFWLDNRATTWWLFMHALTSIINKK